MLVGMERREPFYTVSWNGKLESRVPESTLLPTKYTDVEYMSKRVREVKRENRGGEGRACVWPRLLRSTSYLWIQWFTITKFQEVLFRSI